MENTPSKKHTQRSEQQRRALTNRLSRIEGQIRGIKAMVESDAYCIDILDQASAARAALTAFCRELTAAHIKGCVARGVREGDARVLEELAETLNKLIK